MIVSNNIHLCQIARPKLKPEPIGNPVSSTLQHQLSHVRQCLSSHVYLRLHQLQASDKLFSFSFITHANVHTSCPITFCVYAEFQVACGFNICNVSLFPPQMLLN